MTVKTVSCKALQAQEETAESSNNEKCMKEQGNQSHVKIHTAKQERVYSKKRRVNNGEGPDALFSWTVNGEFVSNVCLNWVIP